MSGLAIMIAKRAAGEGKAKDEEKEHDDDVDAAQELIDSIKDGNADDVKAAFKALMRECSKEQKVDAMKKRLDEDPDGY